MPTEALGSAKEAHRRWPEGCSEQGASKAKDGLSRIHEARCRTKEGSTVVSTVKGTGVAKPQRQPSDFLEPRMSRMNTNHYTEEENLSGSHDDEVLLEIWIHQWPLGTFSVSSELTKKATPEMKLAMG